MKSFTTLLVIFFSPLVLAQTTRFDMRDAIQRNTLVMTSDAPLQKTISVSHYVSGWISLDPEKLASPIEGEFEMDLRALDSGDPARDLEWRKSLLNTAQFPIATATLSDVTFKKARLRDQIPLQGNGTLLVQWRGIKQSIPIALTLTYFHESPYTEQRLSGNLLRVSTGFPIELSQFQITIPGSQSLIYAKRLDTVFDALGSDKLPLGLLPLPTLPKPKG